MKAPSLLEQLKSILLLPFMVIVIVPLVLLNYIPKPSNDYLASLPDALSYSLGSVILVFGLLLFVQSIVLFIKIGRGTLAPWNPTKKLVVKRLYRYLRNPMIVGVLLILLGEAALFKSATLLIWAAVFFSVNHFYFVFKEEPDLQKRFGNEYLEYCNNVPRWLPKFYGWKPEVNGSTKIDD